MFFLINGTKMVVKGFQGSLFNELIGFQELLTQNKQMQ